MIQLNSKYDCCGCSACAQSCPKECIIMRADEEGFLYPQIDTDTCINCGLCERVCPVINQSLPQKPHSVYAAKNKNEDIRLKSSSGGLFTLLAERTINNGGVVFGAKFNDDWSVIHDYTETIDGIKIFRGSKYLQSNTNICYKSVRKFLKEGRKVLFSGTPCQIAGLHLFLNKEYPNLTTVDIICHGVPSPLVWHKYVDLLKSLTTSPLSKISHRDKTEGWKLFGIKAINNNNEIVCQENLQKNIYLKTFLSNLCLRPSCYKCPCLSNKSHSDITIADFWGIEKEIPEFDDDRGCNIILVNSEKGSEIFNSLDCEKIETNFENAIKYNTSYNKSVNEPKYRTYFFKNFHKKGFAIYDIIQHKQRLSLMQRIASRIKHLILK